MWLPEHRLRALGFRRFSGGYWKCERRFGLVRGDHLSIFESSARGGAICWHVFHVTACRAGNNLHFYYREEAANHWSPEGYTDSRHQRRLGLEPERMIAVSDAIAARFVEAIGGEWVGRGMGDWSGLAG